MQNDTDAHSGRRLWIPALALGCAATFAAGGAFALFSGGEDQIVDTQSTGDGGDGTASSTSASSTSGSASTDEASSATTASGNSTPPTSTANEGEPVTTIPESAATLEDGRPATFWAITEETYELVEVDTLSGEVVGRYGGWGPPPDDCQEEEGCLFQAIDNVQLASDGTLYVSDCCEPAVGYIYQVMAGEHLDPLAPETVRYGTNPVPSPDATLVASDELGSIAIRRADDEEAISRYPVEGGDGASQPWHTPLVWLDDTTLVFSAAQGDTASLGFLDVSDPANPTVVGRTIDGPAFLDAGIRSDGRVLALVGTPIEGEDDPWLNRDIVGRAFDPETGEVVAEIDLPDTVFDMDYDASHTYLITSGSDGVVRWYGAGKSGEIGSGFIAVTW